MAITIPVRRGLNDDADVSPSSASIARIESARPPLVDPRWAVLGAPQNAVTAITATLDRIMRHSSVARNEGRLKSAMMLRDPAVSQPLDKILWPVALCETKVVPEDRGDSEQIEAANLLHKLLDWARPQEVYQNLGMAYWYGIAGGGLRVGLRNIDGKQYYVARGLDPVHPDSILFTLEGEPVIRIGYGYMGAKELIVTYKGKQAKVGFDMVRPIAGWESWCRHLTDDELDLFVLHVHNIEAPDFFDPVEAELLYRGRGRRDDVIYPWEIKHQVLRLLLWFLNTFALPIPVGAYPAGNDEIKRNIETAINTYQMGDGALCFPIGMDIDAAKQIGITLLQPGSGGEHIYQYVINHLEDQIRWSIEGQSTTTQSGNVGMGSNIALVHKDTQETYIKMIARGLEQTIADQVLRRLQRWNDILPDVRFKFEFILHSFNPDSMINAARGIRDMGGGKFISVDQLMAAVGLSKADPEVDDTFDEPLAGAGDPAQQGIGGWNAQNKRPITAIG
jgi:hypothetical protein